MITLILRLLRDRKNSIIMYSAFGTGMLWLYILLFPSMSSVGEDLISYMDAMPDAFTKMFPISQATFVSIENFLAIEHYSLMVPLFIIFMLVAMAAVNIASEIEKGTIEILLSRPISRLKIYFARYMVGLIVLVLFIVSSTFMIVPLAGIYNVDYTLTNFISISLLCFIFGWAVFSVAMMISSVFSERNKVYMVVGGLMIGMYVLQIIASISNKLENLQFLSFFYYYDYNMAILEHTLNNTNILVFACVSIICTAFGFYWFNKRDITI